MTNAAYSGAEFAFRGLNHSICEVRGTTIKLQIKNEGVREFGKIQNNSLK